MARIADRNRQHHPGEGVAEGFQAYLERRLVFDVLVQAGGDASQLGVRAGVGHAHQPAPGEDRGAHKDLVLVGFGGFAHRFAFTGQDGFVDGQLECSQEFRHRRGRAHPR